MSALPRRPAAYKAAALLTELTRRDIKMVRVEVVETSSQVWKTCILTAVLHSRPIYISMSTLKSKPQGLVVLGFDFEVALGVSTSRADLGSVFTDNDVATVAANPNRVAVGGKDFFVFDVFQ